MAAAMYLTCLCHVKHGLPPGTIDAQESYLSFHNLIKAGGPVASSEQGLPGFQPALSSGTSNSRRKPVDFGHESFLRTAALALQAPRMA